MTSLHRLFWDDFFGSNSSQNGRSFTTSIHKIFLNMKFSRLLTLALAFVAAQLFGQKTETRTVGDFRKLAVSGGYDKLVLREGSSPSVKITADGIELDKILTTINGSTLEIELKNGRNRNHHIELVVTFTKLEELSSSGSTDVVAESVIRGDRFECNHSGSGNFTGEFEVNRLEINISGSADFALKGRADEQEISISGSGDVDATKLKGQKASVAISGSGDVELNVEKVRSSVSGSGNINNAH